MKAVPWANASMCACVLMLLTDYGTEVNRVSDLQRRPRPSIVSTHTCARALVLLSRFFFGGDQGQPPFIAPSRQMRARRMMAYACMRIRCVLCLCVCVCLLVGPFHVCDSGGD